MKYQFDKKKYSMDNILAKKNIILLVVPLLCGCVRWHCPAFPEDLTLYAPYTEGQIVKFADGSGNTIPLTVTSIVKTRAEKIKYRCKCTCTLPVYSIKMNYRADTTLHFLIAVPFENDNMFTDEIDLSRTAYFLNNDEIIDWQLLFSNDTLCSPIESIVYESHLNNDEILFTSKTDLRDSVLFDSVKVVKGVGITSFCTIDGRKYHLNR